MNNVDKELRIQEKAIEFERNGWTIERSRDGAVIRVYACAKKACIYIGLYHIDAHTNGSPDVYVC